MLNAFGVALLEHLDRLDWTVEDLLEEMLREAARDREGAHDALLGIRLRDEGPRGIIIDKDALIDMMVVEPFLSRPQPHSRFFPVVGEVLRLETDETRGLLDLFMAEAFADRRQK